MTDTYPVRVTNAETGEMRLLWLEEDCYGGAQVEALRRMLKEHGWHHAIAANEETSRQEADEQRGEMSA